MPDNDTESAQSEHTTEHEQDEQPRVERDLMLHIPSGTTDVEFWDEDTEEAEHVLTEMSNRTRSVNLSRELRRQGYEIVEAES